MYSLLYLQQQRAADISVMKTESACIIRILSKPAEVISVFLFFLVETLLCITYYSSTDTFVGKEFQKL